MDSSGNAYVTGYTDSTDFPTANPLQANVTGIGSVDAFVAKLNAAGSALVYSTYLGGSGDDDGNGIAVDSSGNAYVTGNTYSTDFPTANPLQSDHGADLRLRRVCGEVECRRHAPWSTPPTWAAAATTMATASPWIPPATPT